jgi:hypothetical protein
MLSLLEKLHKTDPAFTYRVATDTNNLPCGFVWQTPTMRRFYELYGDVIFLDCMKRKQNSVDWPYIAPTILDADNKIGTVVESIVCSERTNAYVFVMQSLFEMSPGRHKSSVHMIFGDGIMSISLSIESTCNLGLDCYHLMQVDWPRQFGLQLYSQLKKMLHNLIYSSSETEYQKHFQCLKDSCPRKHHDYLHKEIDQHKQHFVRYIVQSYEGNLGRQGDSPAEANHASFCARIGPTSSVEPAEALKNMIERQNAMYRERNKEIISYHLKCTAEASVVLQDSNASVDAKEDALVLTKLSKFGYQLWKKYKEESKNYYFIPGACDSMCGKVRRVGNLSAPARNQS